MSPLLLFKYVLSYQPHKWLNSFFIIFLFSHYYFYWPSGLVCTHHIKMKYTVTSGNVPSFLASYAMVFITLPKTCTVYGFLMTPVVTEALYNHHFSDCHLTKILRHTFQHLLYSMHTSPTYMQTSLWNCLMKKDVFYIHIMFFVPHFLNSKFLQSLTHAEPRVCKQYTSRHMTLYILTHSRVSLH